MKTKLMFIFLLFFTAAINAQNGSKIFEEVKNVTVRNVGAIKKNNEVKGYFSFYVIGKCNFF